MYPEIAMAYESYVLCRSQTLFSVPKQTSKTKSETRIVTWTTGLVHLPLQGGILDQPVRLMAYFHQFIDGDRQAAIDALNKS